MLFPLRPILYFFFGSVWRFLVSAFLCLCLLIIAVLTYVGWQGSNLLLDPPRRPLHSYHTRILEKPHNHNLKIEEYTAKGDTPCLIVTKNRKAQLTSAAHNLIKELSSQEVAISPETYGTILMIHGRMGRKEDMLPVAQRFCAIGFRCICLDLPAHGDHPSSVTTYGLTEANLINDIYKELKGHLKIDEEEPEFLYGFSMGGAVAIRTAAENPEWDGLITISTFANLTELITEQIRTKAKETHPNLEPLAPIVTFAIDRVARLRSDLNVSTVDSEKLLRTMLTPHLLVHGEKDWLVPYSHSQRLLNSIRHKDKKLITVKEGDHGNTLSTGGAKLYADMSIFLLDKMRPDSQLALRATSHKTN